MSLLALAQSASHRRNPAVTAARAASAPVAAGAQAAATQLNLALDVVKRFIPTEFLALYLPFLAIAKDRAAGGGTDGSLLVYLGFLVATPAAVGLLYLAQEAQNGRRAGWREVPVLEPALATVSFAIWGANVPGLFPGCQWWLAMLAMASAFVLPLLQVIGTARPT